MVELGTPKPGSPAKVGGGDYGKTVICVLRGSVNYFENRHNYSRNPMLQVSDRTAIARAEGKTKRALRIAVLFSEV